MPTRENELFDLKLAKECACAFSQSTDLGCTVADISGSVLASFGYDYSACELCSAICRSRQDGIYSHIYGTTEAERFGGKYIYFCPMGLTCFVSPILGSEGSAARITVGPFLMVDTQDYIDCELSALGLSAEKYAAAVSVLEKIPHVPSEKVNMLSTLLFMAVGFMNNVSQANRLMDDQRSDTMQGSIASYIMELKAEAEPEIYPFRLENTLISAVTRGNTKEAHRLLGELLGHIAYAEGSDFSRTRSRTCELLGLLSRGAIDGGASAKLVLASSHNYILRAMASQNFSQLCQVLSEAVTMLSDSISGFAEAKHSNIIHQTLQYLQSHYSEPVTLEDAARRMYLSTSYFSRLFSQETGKNFNTYLTELRIKKACQLMRSQDLLLTDIAFMAGFHDQSYFTKVFKRIMGTTPLKYRNSLIKSEKD